MLDLRRRLRSLERSPFFQQRPDPIDPIIGLVLRETSDQDLELLIRVVRDRDAGPDRTLSQEELAAVAAYEASLDLHRRAGQPK